MTSDDIAHPLLFRTGVGAMYGVMRGTFQSNFYPPHNHGRGIESQYRLVINWSKLACEWLNEKTDHLSDEDACAFVREELEQCIATTVVDQRRTAFGTLADVFSSMRVVAVTCYEARLGGVSSSLINRAEETAHRRFVVHYNGF